MTDVLQELEYFKKLWRASVPDAIEIPPDPTFMAWITSTSRAGLSTAITKTGRRMVDNMSKGFPIPPHAAAKYCSSIASKWRFAQREREQGVGV
jgi:hypothetical protein